MINKILNNVEAKTLFVYEKSNPHVEKVAQEMLDNWIEKDYEILDEEHRVFLEQQSQEVAQHEDWNEVKQTTKVENDVTQEKDQNVRQFDDTQTKTQNARQQNNYFNFVSDEEDESSESSFEITERIIGEIDSDGEEVDYYENDEHVNATMHWDHLNNDYSKIKFKMKFQHSNKKQSHKYFYKKDLKFQWIEMRKKMDELVEEMEALDVDEIRNHTNQIDKICARRDNAMRRKHHK